MANNVDRKFMLLQEMLRSDHGMYTFENALETKIPHIHSRTSPQKFDFLNPTLKPEFLLKGCCCRTFSLKFGQPDKWNNVLRHINSYMTKQAISSTMVCKATQPSLRLINTAGRHNVFDADINSDAK